MFIGPPQTYSDASSSRLGLVVPMKKLLHSCKYSTGANRTILSRVQLQLPVKEGTPNYNIQFVSTFEDLNTPKKTLYGSLGLLRSQYTYEKLLYASLKISAHLQVYCFMQLRDPGTWFKIRNAFVCSQNAATDPPAR